MYDIVQGAISLKCAGTDIYSRMMVTNGTTEYHA